MLNYLRYSALLLLCSLVMASCTLGIKSWPQPQDADGSFAWRSVSAQIVGNCLIIEGRLNGEFENFDFVQLGIEPLGEDACAECPFKPGINKEFHPGDAGFELVGPWMKIQLCGLDQTISYRLQLIGTNRLKSYSAVSSEVVRINP